MCDGSGNGSSSVVGIVMAVVVGGRRRKGERGGRIILTSLGAATVGGVPISSSLRSLRRPCC